MNQLRKAIQSSNFAPVYVVYGEDHYLYQSIKEQFLTQCVPSDERDMNVVVFNLQEASLTQVIEEAESFPFLGDKKVVFVEDTFFLSAEKTKISDAELQKLDMYLARPNPSTILVFALYYPALDKRKKIVKKLQKEAVMIDVNPLNQEGITAYVNDYVKTHGYTIEKNALQELLLRTQANLGMMVQGVDKLMLQVFPHTTVTKQVVEGGISPSLESNVFALSDDLMAKRISRAIQVYRDLILQKEEPIKLLAILMSQYRLMYHIHLLSDQGYQYGDIAKYLGQHPYRVQIAAKQAQRYTKEQLVGCLMVLTDADYQLKTSAMDKDVLMELTLMKMAEIG